MKVKYWKVTRQQGYQEPWVTEFHKAAGYEKIYADTINTIYAQP